MTGLFPISVYSRFSWMALNNFAEYNVVNDHRYEMYFGFTEEEVDELYKRYVRINGTVMSNGGVSNDALCVTRDGLREWYGGYRLDDGNQSIYNPWSVVHALESNELRSYWIDTDSQNEIVDYLAGDLDGITEKIEMLITGKPVMAHFYNDVSIKNEFNIEDELFSMMVMCGFLNYEFGRINIPNRELREAFEIATSSAGIG